MKGIRELWNYTVGSSLEGLVHVLGGKVERYLAFQLLIEIVIDCNGMDVPSFFMASMTPRPRYRYSKFRLEKHKNNNGGPPSPRRTHILVPVSVYDAGIDHRYVCCSYGYLSICLPKHVIHHTSYWKCNGFLTHTGTRVAQLSIK